MSKLEKAKAILAAGGYWRKALESSYRGGEQFQIRLRNERHFVVKGFGFATHKQMLEADLLASRVTAPSSLWPEEWVLKVKEE